jgi:hypothetical protein
MENKKKTKLFNYGNLRNGEERNPNDSYAEHTSNGGQCPK